MKLRLMKKKDIPFVLKIGKKEKYFEVSKKLSGFWTKFQFDKWVESENDVLIVAEEDKIVGFALSSLHKSTGKATFENMWVDPNFRKMGVAQKMTEILIKKLKEKGATYICGFTKEDNKKMLNLFGKLKFDRGFKFYWMGRII